MAVAEAYLKPVVDDGQGAFSWGRPDLEQIREFCATAFGWYRSKTDDILLPVLKQLNNQQTQLRIDSFFRLEQYEKQAIKSQRLRRAVTCMQRKEKEGYIVESEEPSSVLDQTKTPPGKKIAKRAIQDSSTLSKRVKKASNPQSGTLTGQEGGFLGDGQIADSEDGLPSGDSEYVPTNSNRKQTLEVNKTSKLRQKKTTKDKIKTTNVKPVSSSSDEDEAGENIVMVTARSVFENKVGKIRSVRVRKQKK